MDNVTERYKKNSPSTKLKYGIIEVTTKCQCACPGCYMVRRNALNKGQMNLEQAVNVLDLCKEYCGQELETMDILGGEPLLWPYLKEYIEELLHRGISPWIFTNMLAMTSEMANWLFERQIHITGKLNTADLNDPEQLALQAEMIGSSLSQSWEMHQKIRMLQNVGYKKPLFRLQNLIRKDNIRYAPGYYQFCLINEIETDLELMGSGEAIDDDYWQIAPSPPEIAVIIMKIQLVRHGFGLEPAEVLMPHIFGSCPFYDKGLYFGEDGHIRACSNSTTILANIKTDNNPIKKAFESELICNRHKLSKETVGEPCCNCYKWEKCRGGCRATAEGMGDPFGGYPLCPAPYLG